MPSVAFVAAQIVALVVLVLPWEQIWHAPGWPFVVAAGLLGAWTLLHNRLGNFSVMPEPRASARLITTGPYALVRHPMYAALLLFGAGMLAGWQGAVHLVALAALSAVLHFKADREEALMAARFPEYEAYRSRTKRLIPFVL